LVASRVAVDWPEDSSHKRLITAHSFGLLSTSYNDDESANNPGGVVRVVRSSEFVLLQ